MKDNLAFVLVICAICVSLSYCGTTIVKENNRINVLEKEIELYNLTNKQR